MTAGTSIKRLDQIKSLFGANEVYEKEHLLTIIRQSAIKNRNQLILYHESLCYLRAYADNQAVLELVEAELNSFAVRVTAFKRQSNWTDFIKIHETGIVGTFLTHPYGYELTIWLMERFGKSVDLDLESYRRRDDDPVQTLLPLVVTWSENDAVDDPFISAKELIDKERKGSGGTYLQWLITNYDRLSADPAWKRLHYDNLELTLKINIGNSFCSRTLIKLPVKKYYFQSQPLTKEYPVLVAVAQQKKLRPRLLPPVEGSRIIDYQKQAMVMRHRELYPLTFANPREVYAAAVGRGITVYVIGMMPEMRLPLESDYSSFIVRNGVPIGYGIGAMVFERIEIAINIFETFRKGEAAYIFGKFVELHSQLFGCSYLLIKRYQVGYNNPEGLDSGAYWFYYKLGFRSVGESERRLAEAERAKIAADHSYRTPRATLKKLAESDLCLNLHDPQDFKDRDLPLGQVALFQTKTIGERYHGDRDLAEKESVRRVKEILGLRSTKGWTRDQILWLKRFSILIATLPGIENWKDQERRLLAEIIKAKGALHEREYVRLLLRHVRFKNALLEIA